MMRRTQLKVGWVVLLPFLLGGCAPLGGVVKPLASLDKYFQQQDLNPYVLKTNKSKIGSIVTFPEERRSLLELANASECFDDIALDELEKKTPEELTLPSISDKRKSSYGIPSILMNDLLEKLQLGSGAASASVISNVDIVFKDSLLYGYTAKAITDAMLSIKEGCEKYTAGDDKYVIFQEVVSNNTSYTFTDDKGVSVIIGVSDTVSDSGVPVLMVQKASSEIDEEDRELLRKEELRESLENADGIYLSRNRQGTLISEKPMVIAYKALKISGLAQGKYSLKEHKYRSVSIAESGPNW